MQKTLLMMLSLWVTTVAFADTTIMEQTQTWESVPITVNKQSQTYTTVEAAALPSSEYYYTYPGYRCVKEKRAFAGEVVRYHSGTAGGKDIYCYPVP